MKEKTLTFAITGSMTKLQRVIRGENQLAQIQIKSTDKIEAMNVFEALDNWGVPNIADMLPGLDIPWSKMTVPLTDYHIFTTVNFGVNPANGVPEIMFDAKLESLVLSKKVKDDGEMHVEHVECTFNLFKNDEPSDCTIGSFVKYKDYDELGKKHLKLFNVNFVECDNFILGAPEPEQDA